MAMAVFTNSFFIDLLLMLTPVVYLVYWYLTNNDDYWDKRGVPNDKKGYFFSILAGKVSNNDVITQRYKTFSGKKFGGFISLKQPGLLVRDPQLIHKILVKDFTHFPNRPQPNVKNDPLSASLLSLKGQVWRTLRYKLTPTFTTGKLKGMFEQIAKCGDNMIEKIDEISKDSTELESKTFLFEFTLDVISSCAFGLQFKPNSPDFNKFKLFVSKLFKFSPLNFIKFMVILLFPKFAELIDIRTFPKEYAEYFLNLTKSTTQFRKNNNIQRNDYFQLLLTLKEQEESGKDMGLTTLDTTEEDDAVINQMQYAGKHNQASGSTVKLFTDNVICANTFIFLLAGSESTASTINFTLFELCRHPDIQKLLQQEVDSVLVKHGSWTYAAIKDMVYLDQIIQETQRLYPVLPFLMRECEEPYNIPDSDVTIEKGVQVIIPVCALHKDPQYYPDPDEFKPERFESNNFKPNPTFLPFGDGPRICIAMRFAVMEVKTCVARIMSQYSVKLNSKTHVPLQFDPWSLFPTVKGGIWLSFEKRNIK